MRLRLLQARDCSCWAEWTAGQSGAKWIAGQSGDLRLLPLRLPSEAAAERGF